MNLNRKSQRHRGAGRRTTFGVMLPVMAVLFLASGATPAGPGADEEVENVRPALEKWVELRRVISKEKRDWALGKEMLDDRIALVKREIESLQKSIGEAEESIADADRKRDELFRENEELKVASNALSGTINALETSTRELLRRLPDPIRERVKPLSQQIPDKPEETKLSLSQRFQNIAGILNEVNKFNREITVTSEVRTLGDGTTAEVTSVYVGIGQGYYASADGLAAGVGRSTSEGYVWIAANESAAEISKAIAIVKNEVVADFVLLPVQID